ncbi:hypothetical protein MN1_450 [Thermus phage MN1]|nr:hypothetical protein MN1_450 [Thermus phage MN1]
MALKRLLGENLQALAPVVAQLRDRHGLEGARAALAGMVAALGAYRGEGVGFIVLPLGEDRPGLYGLFGIVWGGDGFKVNGLLRVVEGDEVARFLAGEV